MEQKSEPCRCGVVEKLASEPQFPIDYDPKLNEYNLLSPEGKVFYRMYFCFFCGGKLPESRRTSLFAEPSPEDVDELASILGSVTSIQQVFRLLGEPDETAKAPKASSKGEGRAGVNYKKHHRYLNRWKTLDLTVMERADGSINYAFTGKYKGRSKRHTTTE